MAKKTLKLVADAFDKLAFELIKSADALSKPVTKNESVTQDTFTSFYRRDLEWTKEADPVLKRLHDMPEFQSIKEQTPLDEISSALAVAHFAPTLIEQEEEQAELVAFYEDENAEEEVQVEDPQQQARARAALRRAAADTEKTLEQWEDAKAAWGIEPGELKNIPGPERMDLVQSLLSNKKLLQISELIGRFSNVANGIDTQTFSHGFDEVYEVGFGRNLSRLLPSELVKLKTTPGKFWQDYCEGRLAQYELKGNEPQAKGPIIVALDTSGSMQGWREDYARALAMALASIASNQRRAFHILFFDSKLQDEKTWAANERMSLADRLALVNRVSDGGGTDFEAPLSRALEIKKSVTGNPFDLVFITDGECHLSPQFFEKFMAEKKKADLRVTGLILGNAHPDLAFCDSVHTVSSEGELGAVKDILKTAAEGTP